MLICVYEVIFLTPNKKLIDFDPNTKYPQEVLFKYFCLLIVTIAVFLGFVTFCGFIIVLLTIIVTCIVLWGLKKLHNTNI